MAIISNVTNFIIVLVAFILFAIAGVLNINFSKPKLEVSKQTSAININTKIFKLFSAGQNRLLSDFFWIATLLESDLEHYQEKDNNSWMFQRFNTITTLDPNFLQAYQFGGKYLSIIKDDIVGARALFEKGLKYYPDNYELLFNFGFLLAFEDSDFETAHKIYKKLATYPQAPDFIKTLSIKIFYAQSNDLIQVLEILKNLFNNEPENSPLRTKLWHDIYSIQAELDLNCLNNNQPNCNKVDVNGQRYFIENGKYTSIYKFRPYKLNFGRKKSTNK